MPHSEPGGAKVTYRVKCSAGATNFEYLSMAKAYALPGDSITEAYHPRAHPGPHPYTRILMDVRGGSTDEGRSPQDRMY
jgi:hypothetical protein